MTLDIFANSTDDYIIGPKPCLSCSGKGFIVCKNRWGHKWERHCNRCDGTGKIRGIIYVSKEKNE